MGNNKNVIPFILLIVSLSCTVIILYPPVFDYLRDISLVHIKEVRENAELKKFDKVMDLASNIADKYGIAIAIAVFLAVLSPINAQILLGAGATSVAVNIGFKMIMRDPRPYFYSTSYKPVSCDFEYGAPSGHGQCSTSFYLTALTLILAEFKSDNGDDKNSKSADSSFGKRIKGILTSTPKFLLYSLVLLFCCFISYTRIYTGLHTLEQILLGLGLGISAHLLVAHILREDIENLFIGIESGKTSFFNPLMIIYVGLNLFVILAYFYIETYEVTPQLWVDTISKNGTNLHRFKSLPFAGVIKQLTTTANIGGYGACFVRRWMFKDNISKIPLNSLGGFLKRFVFNAIIGGVLMLPLFLTPRDAPLLTQALWRATIPSFSSAFIITLLQRRIFS